MKEERRINNDLRTSSNERPSLQLTSNRSSRIYIQFVIFDMRGEKDTNSSAEIVAKK